MLKKTPVKKTNKTSVLFQATGLEDATKVDLAGEFNDWGEPKSTPMKRRKDGTWSVAVRLPNDERFEYRFVVDGKTWIVDEAADEFAPNPFGGRNSVCDLTD